MNKRLTVVLLMVLISCFGVFAGFSNAQQNIEKEIAKNQVEQVKLELEIANNEVIDADSNVEEEYLGEQAKSLKDADIAQKQIDGEAELLLEQANQEAEQRRQAMDKEEQAHLEKAVQETEQQATEIEEINQMINSDISNQE